MSRYRLGQIELDFDASTISRAGKTIDVRPRSMAVLRVLAERPRETISKDEIFDQVWGDVVVTEDALTQCIVELRKAFGDSSRRPEVIQTVRARGYRMLQAPVLIAKADTVAVDTQRTGSAKVPLAIVVVALVAWTVFKSFQLDFGSSEVPEGGEVSSTRLVVLPFANFSDTYPDSFADGLTEELIHHLTQLPELGVIARTSAFKYKGDRIDVRDLVEDLAVDYLIEGSVRSEDQVLRITAQLIETEGRTHRWSRVYEFQSDAALDIQQQVAAEIAGLLGTSGVEQVVPLDIQPLNVDRSALLFRGRALLRDQSFQATVQALEVFDGLIASDSGDLRFWLGRAQANLNMLWNGSGDESHVEGLQQSLEMAARLSPNDPDLQRMMADRVLLDQDYRKAIEIYRRGLSAHPRHGGLMLGLAQALRRSAQWDEAIVLSDQALSRDPLNPRAHMNLGMIYSEQRDVEQAERSLQRAAELSEYPSNAFWGLGLLYRNQGQLDRAIEAYDRAIEAGDQTHLRLQRARLFLNLGMIEQARADHGVANGFGDRQFSYILAVWEAMATGREEDLRAVLDAFPTESPVVTYERLVAGMASAALGETELALRHFSEGLMSRTDPDPLLYNFWDIDTGTMVALQYASALLQGGEEEQAAALVAGARTSLEALSTEQQAQPASLYTRAQILALEGEGPAALTVLQQAVDAGWRRLYWMRRDPSLSSIADSPQFARLAEDLQNELLRQAERLKARTP